MRASCPRSQGKDRRATRPALPGQGGFAMSVRLRVARMLSMFVVMAIITGQTAAQTRSSEASLRITVLDPSGAAVAAAQAQLKIADGKNVTLATNERGESLFTNVAPGRYVLHVEAAGFEARDTEVKLKAGSNRVDVRLEVAGVKEEVAVGQD